MKRDMELVRMILLELENAETEKVKGPLYMEGYYESGELAYHLTLLKQAELIEAEYLSNFDGAYWTNLSLNWNGHEFLDAVRQDTIWEKMKETMGAELNKVPIQAIATIGIELTKQWAFNKMGLNSKT